jgi:Chlorophyll A-B binding protein
MLSVKPHPLKTYSAYTNIFPPQNWSLHQMTNITKDIVNSDRNAWIWGFTPQAEVWNGRLAMIGFAAAILTEILSGQGVLHYWNVIQTSISVPPMR